MSEPLIQPNPPDIRKAYREITRNQRKQITPRVTQETTQVPLIPALPEEAMASREKGEHALFIPFFREHLSFSARKLCPEMKAYQVVLTSKLTTKYNYQSRLLSDSTKTLRSPAKCFVFPSQITESLIDSINTLLAEGESAVREIMDTMYPVLTDHGCVIPQRQAVFTPRALSDLGGVEDICILNRPYEVTIVGVQRGDKVPVKILLLASEGGESNIPKERLFKAPISTLTLNFNGIKFGSVEASVKDCDTMTLEKINTLIESMLPSEDEGEDMPQDLPEDTTLPDAPEMDSQPSSEVDDVFLPDAPEIEDDLPEPDAPEIEDDLPDLETPTINESMEPQAEIVYLRSQVASLKQITELQNELYALSRRVRKADMIVAIVSSFQKTLADILQEYSE